MIQDYLIRQLKQFIQVLETILLKRREGKEHEALALIDESLSNLEMDDKRDFDDFNLKDLYTFFAKKHPGNPEFIFLIADLLFEKASIMNNEDADLNYQKSLLLYELGSRTGAPIIPLESFQKIDFIKKRLSEEDLNEVYKIVIA